MMHHQPHLTPIQQPPVDVHQWALNDVAGRLAEDRAIQTQLSILAKGLDQQAMTGAPAAATSAKSVSSAMAGGSPGFMGALGSFAKLGQDAYGLATGSPQRMAEQLKPFAKAEDFAQEIGPRLATKTAQEALLGIGTGATAGSVFGPIGAGVGGALGGLMAAAPTAYAGGKTLGPGEMTKQSALGGASMYGHHKAGRAGAQAAQGVADAAPSAIGGGSGGASSGYLGAAAATAPFALLAFTPQGRELFGDVADGVSRFGKKSRSSIKKLGKKLGL